MYLLLFLSALLAEIIGTIAGFGSSTVFLPLALLFLNFKTALVLVAFFHIFGNISRVSFFKHGLDRNLLTSFGLPSVILTIVGALRGAFLTAFKLPKERYIATASAIALAVDFTRLPIYIAQGFLSKEFYWYIPILLILAVTGSYIGKQIVTKIPQQSFRKLVLVALIIVGFKFIFY